MPGQTLNTEAFVIERRPPTDAFQALGLFSAEHGNLLAMQRVPRRPNPSHAPADLFDQVSATLETSNQGRTWFVKELRIGVRRPGIGRSYDALRFASAFAALIGRNPVHEESRGQVASLLAAALDAFEEGIRPDAVHLKSLYLFARDEGYPVKQEWLAGLGEADRALAGRILSRKAREQDAPAKAVERIRRSLENYLGSSTEILLP